MKTKALLIVLSIILINISGCEEAVQEISFETIDKSSYGGVREKKEIVIKNFEDWETIWKEVKSIQISVPETPVVDFSKEMVVALFMGERTTGGYSTEITRITEDGIVYYKEKEPGKGMMVTQALTQPYHIVKMENMDKEIEFVLEE